MLAMGSGRKAKSSELGADGQHEPESAGGEDDGVRRVHDGRAEQHADGIEIVSSARHDVAGAVALIVGVGQAFEVSEKVVTQIEFNNARDSDDHPARQKLEDALDQSDGNDEERVSEKLVAGDSGVEIVDGATQDLREENPDAVIA